ncbi:hypothetical protein ACFY8K_03775 [Streptomyces misionensis]|uniref:hypothetical protein n=1 Tax=Streptomyces misionensis TaxID=67331 RepID=UPI00368A519A
MARTDGIPAPLAADDIKCWAGKEYQGVGPAIRVPIRGKHLRGWRRRHHRDHAKIRSLGERAMAISHAPYRLDLTLPPEPFLGLHDAPLVMLLANPGVSDADPAAYARPGATERTLQHIANAGGTPNHFLTHPDKDHPGLRWWSGTLNGLTKLALQRAARRAGPVGEDSGAG